MVQLPTKSRPARRGSVRWAALMVAAAGGGGEGLIVPLLVLNFPFAPEGAGLKLGGGGVVMLNVAQGHVGRLRSSNWSVHHLEVTSITLSLPSCAGLTRPYS